MQVSRAASAIAVRQPFGGAAVALDLVSMADAVDLLGASAAAQPAWSATPLPRRMEMCTALMQGLQSFADLPAEISTEMGKPVSQARGEVAGAIDRAAGMIEMAESELATEDIADGPISTSIVKEPVGTVLSITPWNYPLLTTVNSLIPALLAGNSVVIKPSPHAARTAEYFARAAEAAGFAPGIVSVLNASNDVVADLIGRDHRDGAHVGAVSFTGSVRGGREVYEVVGKSRFIDVTLELGGQDAAYISEHADLEYAVAGVVDGAMYNAGQSCCSIERVYVHESHWDEFIERAVALLKEYKLGSPFDDDTSMGPLTLEGAAQALEDKISAAGDRATVFHGGRCVDVGSGYSSFLEPTLVGITSASRGTALRDDELFGPVLLAQPVSGSDEAVAEMNDSDYGLTAAIFTNDKEEALAMAPRLQAGTIFMNRCDFLDPALAWTGFKNTGKGVSLSRHGFGLVTQLKSYHFKTL